MIFLTKNQILKRFQCFFGANQMSPQEFGGANPVTSVGSFIKPSLLFLYSTKYVTFQWTGTSQSPFSVLLTIIIFAIVKTSRWKLAESSNGFVVTVSCHSWPKCSSTACSHQQAPTPTNAYKLLRNTTPSHYHDSVEKRGTLFCWRHPIAD